MKPVNKETHTEIRCHRCKAKNEVARSSIRYWPDHLWAGKIMAYSRCASCDEWNGVWAHDLPVLWVEMDCPCREWEQSAMPRLLDSCIMKGIKPHVFHENLIPLEKRKSTPKLGFLARLWRTITA